MKLKSLGSALTGIKTNLRALLSKSEENENQYLIIYKTREDKTKSYIIKKPDLYESFGNKDEDRDNVGVQGLLLWP